MRLSRLEDQRPVPSYAADPAGQVDGTLAVPVGQQRVEGADVLVEQLGVAGAGAQRRQAQDAACGRRARASRSAATGSGSGEDGVRRVGEVVEVLDVRAQQVGGAGQVLGDARTSSVSSSGQHRRGGPATG